MKRVIIVHGWEGTPDEGWFPWLKKELESKGFDVLVPQLPDTMNPHIDTWVPALATAVGEVDADTYFVGHSMGCQTIARFLATLPEGVQAGGAVFVAGFFQHITGLTEEADLVMDAEWHDTPLDLDVVRKHMRGSVAIFSDDDPYVALSNVEDFKDTLGSEIVVLPKHRHFSGSSGYLELPIVLEKVLELSR